MVVKRQHFYVKVTLSCKVASLRIWGLLEAYFRIKKTVVTQGKESIIRVRVGQKNPSLRITVCHHSASLVMPNGDLRDGFFYPSPSHSR